MTSYWRRSEWKEISVESHSHMNWSNETNICPSQCLLVSTTSAWYDGYLTIVTSRSLLFRCVSVSSGLTPPPPPVDQQPLVLRDQLKCSLSCRLSRNTSHTVPSRLWTQKQMLTFSGCADMWRTLSELLCMYAWIGTCVHTYIRMYLCVLCCTCVYFAGHVTDFEWALVYRYTALHIFAHEYTYTLFMVNILN